MNLKKAKRCKHGMIPKWCAYCQKLPQKSQVKTTGRGVGRIFGDRRPMMIWRKEVTA